MFTYYIIIFYKKYETMLHDVKNMKSLNDIHVYYKNYIFFKKPKINSKNKK